jgi:hypothetical protein
MQVVQQLGGESFRDRQPCGAGLLDEPGHGAQKHRFEESIGASCDGKFLFVEHNCGIIAYRRATGTHSMNLAGKRVKRHLNGHCPGSRGFKLRRNEDRTNTVPFLPHLSSGSHVSITIDTRIWTARDGSSERDRR